MLLPFLSPNISHSSLLRWWFNSNSLIDVSAQSAAYEISTILDSHIYSNIITSGFEFHHYKSTRLPDYLVYLSSSDLSSLPNNSLPVWWDTYFNALTTSTEYSAFSFIPENWLEFDYISPKLILTGLWQRLSEPIRSYDYDQWINVAKLLSNSFIPFESLVNSSLIRHIVSCFSLPEQIGLMHGRSSNLKLMYHLSTPASLENFVDFINSSDSSIKSIFLPISKYLLEYGHILRPAISFDIDLRSNMLSSNDLSIEIHEKHQIGRQLSIHTYDFISSLVTIDSDQFVDLNSLLKTLPFAQSFSYSLENNSMTSLTNISRLNHIKFQYRSSSWKVKSYVKLIQLIS